jgi:hypothetical protein
MYRGLSIGMVAISLLSACATQPPRREPAEIPGASAFLAGDVKMNLGYMSLDYLLAMCDSSSAVDRAACDFYILGVIDNLAQVPSQQSTCFRHAAKDATLPELRTVVIRYLRENRGNGWQGAAFQGWLGLVDAYPCKAGVLN